VKIAIMGTRGIPANYGGFETFAEECATGLAERGHDVTVYGRSHYVPRELRRLGKVRLVVLPTLRLKYTDTVVHTLLSVLHGLVERYDVILICNAANSVFAAIPRLFRTPVVVNVDGLERLRGKWNWLGRTYYRLSESLSTWIPNVIVTDARVIEQYYRSRHDTPSVFIPYGARIESPPGRAILERLGLQPRDYFLYVSRFEPENNAHRVVAAFERVRTTRRLVMVGDAPYSTEYIRSLRRTGDDRILFPGSIYGEGYWELMANAFCYVHATEVGGTHPALIEAMGQGNVIIANQTPENEEVLGGTGVLYRRNDVGDLARLMETVSNHPERYESLGQAARERARVGYSWNAVVGEYEKLFRRLVEHT
jgi:glycosyltransferase involved in cell wall biosynthesis